MSFLVLLALVILLFGISFLRVHVKAWMLSRLGFEDLLAKVKPVPREAISAIALDYLEPVKGQLRIQPAELWALIGGEAGVRRMYANAGVLIALAVHAQRWNPEEGVIVAERMRRDGVTLRRAALNLEMNFVVRFGDVFVPFDVQELAGSYFLMTKRLLALYETSHVGRHPDLISVL